MTRPFFGFDPHAVSRAGVLDGSPVCKRGGRPACSDVRGPFAGMLSSPCGVWVRIERFQSGLPWARLCRGASMRGVIGVAL